MTTKQAQDAKPKPETVRLKPTGFWSYSRQDDELSFGKLSQLRKLLMAEVQQQFGRERVQIFQDAETISHGAEWEGEIRQSLEDSTFFIPIITPNFIQSEWCSREVSLFFEREQRLFETYPDLPRRGRIFPLLLIDVDDVDAHDDAVWAELKKRQMFDYRALRFRSLQDEQVHQALAGFAGAIREILQIKVKRPLTAEERARIEADALLRAEAEAVEAARLAEERRLEALRQEEERLAREAEAARLAEERRRAAEAEAAAQREAEARRLREAEEESAARAEEEKRQQALQASSLAAQRAAEHLAERERDAQAQQGAPAMPPGGHWAGAPLAGMDAAPPRRSRSLLLWIGLGGALILALIVFLLLRSGGEQRSVGTAETPPGAVNRPNSQAGTPPIVAEAPAHAWLYGRWCLANSPSIVRTISGDGSSITLAFNANSQTERILSATPTRVLTNISEYLMRGDVLRVTEPEAQFSYEMRRCAAPAD